MAGVEIMAPADGADGAARDGEGVVDCPKAGKPRIEKMAVAATIERICMIFPDFFLCIDSTGSFAQMIDEKRSTARHR